MTIPLLIGIIGHRKLLPEYQESLTGELENALDSIRSHVRNTEIFIASSLAPGADRLGAAVGLSKNFGLIVPLPFDKEKLKENLEDYGSDFDKLIAQAKYSFVASESGFGSVSKCCPFEAASRWIARHCQLIIALWDGEITNAKALAPGGTAHTVQLRCQVGRGGDTLSSVSDYLGPVLHLHCPRTPGGSRKKPRWILPMEPNSRIEEVSPAMDARSAIQAGQWPGRRCRVRTWTDRGAGWKPNERFEQTLLKVVGGLLPLDNFNKEAMRIQSKLPLDENDCLLRAFSVADKLALSRQRRYLRALNYSVALAVFGYLIQQAWVTMPGRLIASLFLTFALVIIFLSARARNMERYLEYRALAEVLRVAVFWRNAGITTLPTARFLSQHLGNLRWVRSAVHASSIPGTRSELRLDLVKERWIDDQENYYKTRSAASGRAIHVSRWFTSLCFGLSVISAWIGAVKGEWGFFTTVVSGVLLLLVGAVTHYVRTRGWEEDASRYSSMASPFFWCQKIWPHADHETRRTLVRELGDECVAEISSWLLVHRNRPISLIKA